LDPPSGLTCLRYRAQWNNLVVERSLVDPVGQALQFRGGEDGTPPVSNHYTCGSDRVIEAARRGATGGNCGTHSGIAGQ
jgi:hypothetical protein